MSPVLAYWKIRGLAQPIRLLLNYVGVEFEDKLYEQGDAPDFSRECWTKEKDLLGLDFPNLPYYIEGDVKISQSNTILHYLGRKHALSGSTEQEKIVVDLMLEVLMDFRNGLVRLCYNPMFESLFPDYIQTAAKQIDSFEAFLGNKTWLAGNQITVVDFVMYELLDQHRIMIPHCLDAADELRAFLDRFENLPAIKAFMDSDKFMKRPLNNKVAAFK